MRSRSEAQPARRAVGVVADGVPAAVAVGEFVDGIDDPDAAPQPTTSRAAINAAGRLTPVNTLDPPPKFHSVVSCGLGSSRRTPYPDVVRTPDSSAAPRAIGRPRVTRASLVIMLLALVLASCGAGSEGPSAATSGASGLSSARLAAAGLCAATAALPDPAATKRAFINDAHDALHTLASDPGLTRAASARVLEAIDQLERDFDASAEAPELSTDLAALAAATSGALVELGLDVPPCG